MSPPLKKKKKKKKKKSLQNVFDSRTYFAPGKSTGSAEALVCTALTLSQICAICAVPERNLRIIRLWFGLFPPTPSSPVAFSRAGYCKVATSVTFHRLMKPKKKKTRKKTPTCFDLLLNCVIVPINLGYCEGCQPKRCARQDGNTFVM